MYAQRPVDRRSRLQQLDQNTFGGEALDEFERGIPKLVLDEILDCPCDDAS